MHLQLSVEVVLYKLLDAGGREVEGRRTVFDEIFFEFDDAKSWAIFRLQAEELKNTQVVVIHDVDVDEQHLTQTFTKD